MKTILSILVFISIFIFVPKFLIGQDQKASDVGALSGELMPVGSVISYAGSSAPNGWLLAYGQEISQTTYSNLYAVIGITYCTAFHGSGGGCSVGNFRLPDLRGRLVSGKDNMGGVQANRISSSMNGTTLGISGGSDSFSLAMENLPHHVHNVSLNSNATGVHLHNIVLSASGSGVHNHASAAYSTATSDPGAGSALSTHGHTLYAKNNFSTSGSTRAVAYTISNGTYGTLTGYTAGPGSPATNHTHIFSIPALNTSNSASHGHSVSGNSDNAGNHQHTTTGDTGNGSFNASAIARIQPTTILNYIIKY